jgi:hypothetical protein
MHGRRISKVDRRWMALGSGAVAASYLLGRRRGTRDIRFHFHPSAARNMFGGSRSEMPDRPPRSIPPIPRMPITLDGTRTAPETVVDVKDQTLRYFWDRRVQEEGVLPVFTTSHAAEAYWNSASESPASARQQDIGVSRQAISVRDGTVALYEHIDFGGWRWFFAQNWGDIPDFTCVYPTVFWCNNINDRVSCIENNTTTTFLVLHEHINFAGARLFMASDFAPDLTLIGWNDRISSMSYSDVAF